LINKKEEIKMYITNKNIRVILLSLSFLLIISCSKYVDIKEGSEKIMLVKEKPANCVSKGTVDVSVLAEIAYIEREEKYIHKDLVQLAKNSAVSVRANTIMKIKTPKPGEATFAMYKCTRPWAE
jgi:hypothetical protein